MFAGVAAVDLSLAYLSDAREPPDNLKAVELAFADIKRERLLFNVTLSLKVVNFTVGSTSFGRSYSDLLHSDQQLVGVVGSYMPPQTELAARLGYAFSIPLITHGTSSMHNTIEHALKKGYLARTCSSEAIMAHAGGQVLKLLGYSQAGFIVQHGDGMEYVTQLVETSGIVGLGMVKYTAASGEDM